ncbi:hypothetical protein Gorai_023513 [Gossypium raimondii]|uniref:Amino acid transporter transmembrane domain-containing protein n=1 Tax=Gossypium raimondii TaxID=29730 RepID=A0A7J8NX73_GOSRA|nr:hypothetical protein [Gossypium raimondii]
MEKNSERIPLINPSPSSSTTEGRASKFQTIGNIIVSIVGTGVLGLPFAFRVAGWLAGSLGVILAGFATFYCMLLLVQCRDKSASENKLQGTITYGDLGYICIGKPGRYLTEFLIFISQCGGSVAYLVFIGQNLVSVFKGQTFSVASYIFLLVPIEIALSWIGSLSAFSPFSIFADICNVLAMGFVVKEEIERAIGGGFSFRDRKAIADNLGGLPFAGGMAVFCFEGFGMTLALEQSMKERNTFPKVLGMAFTWITLMYVLFGSFGYLAYGDETKDIITLNLPNNWTATAVQKLNNNDAENSITGLGKLGTYTSRAVLIIGLAVLASYVPGFGIFASLVGSTVCALISFVLPASFHLTLLGSSLSLWQKALDCCILLCGLIFAAYGTYNTIVGI